jgi:hypothetical protein
MFLLSAGAALLAGLIIRSLRRRHLNASTSRGVEVTSTAKVVRQPAASRGKTRGRALLAASTESATRAHAASTSKTRYVPSAG